MPVAGHVDAGKSLLNACVRETKEELCIDVCQKDFEFLGEYQAAEFWEFGQVYLLKIDAKEDEMSLQKEEVSQVKWLNYKDFEKLFYSSKFCNFKKDYRDWICKTLKNKLK